MKLYLMRHGQAASSDIDPEKGLSSVGKMEIEELAHRLKEQGVTFNQVFHSNKARARQSAEIMTKILAPDVTPLFKENLKPNDDPAILLPDIESWQDDTLIASHLPFVPSLLMLLLGENQTVNFVPGTVACLTRDGLKWHLEWISRP